MKKINKEKLLKVLIVALPILAFGITLYIYWPGILSYDSYVQLNEINSGVFSNWHPIMHTLLEFVLMKI